MMNREKAKIILQERELMDNEFLFGGNVLIKDGSLRELFDYISEKSNAKVSIIKPKNIVWNDHSTLRGDAYVVKVELKRSVYEEE